MRKPEPVTVFLSYAHKDESLRSELEKHLSLLQRQGLISTWQDRQITAGTKREQEIDEHLNSASIILLLVSADFVASDYCYGVEMQHALDRDKAGQVRVIPIALRPCDWRDAPFAHLQVLPTNAKAITTWNNRDEAWTDVANGIRRVIAEDNNTAINVYPKLLAINSLSYPRIALIALIGQILLIVALASGLYDGAKYGPKLTGAWEDTLLLVIFALTSICGVIGTAIAFGMSLSKAKQLQRWGWVTGLIIGFIGLFILFLPALIPLLFGLFGPKEQRAAQTRN